MTCMDPQDIIRLSKETFWVDETLKFLFKYFFINWTTGILANDHL